MSEVFSNNHGSTFQGARGSFQNVSQPLNHEQNSCVPETQQYYADHLSRVSRGDLPKVEIESYNDSAFHMRLGKNIRIRHPLQALVTEMSSVMAIFPEPNYNPVVHVHIG